MFQVDQERIVIERCTTPRGELQLQRRGDNYEIISNGTFLMATYNGESERLLVRASLERVEQPKKVMIGGLGVGFSLAEALTDPRVEEVTVVEIEADIIKWNESHLSQFSNHALDNPRTRIVNADLLKWIVETDETFDAICLDIDNGPDWTVTEDNESLYGEHGLLRLIRLLNPNGILTFWSANPSPVFAQRLTDYFSEVEEFPVDVGIGDPDVVYLVRSPK